MKQINIIALVIFVALLVSSVIYADCGMCEPAPELKGDAHEHGSRGRAMPKEASVKGKVFFSDYYSMGGKKCAAFIEQEDGSLVCVLDNMATASMKREMKGQRGKVEVKGNMIGGPQNKFIEVEEFDVLEKKEDKGSKSKGSQKGSH